MLKYIIFDFDGTLADTYEEVKKVIEEFKDYRTKRINFEDIRDKGIRSLVKEAKIPFWQIPKASKKVMKKLRKKENIELFPEMRSVINWLNERYKLGIVSSNSKQNIKKNLRVNNLLGSFCFTFSGSSLFGKHRVLKKAIKKYSLNPNEVIYIGDEDRDIIAAKKAGIRIIAVSWGFNSKKRLIKENPDYIAESPKELIKIIQNIK